MRLRLKKNASAREKSRAVKKVRIRKKILGSAERPRLSVFKSAKHIYAQIIDDSVAKTLAEASSLKLGEELSGIPLCKEVGKLVAQAAAKKKITNVVFDRNGFKYHGRIKAFADSAREAGLKF